jgi:hypothetical protein
MVSGGICLVIALINIWALIAHPEDRGIEIDENDESVRK